MLARVANNLFWMGRYIERAEHLARYLNVNYF
ncbi:MAG: alpha-E domain-containing protein, partial [Bacteroidota bacterium]|nr:alpha-E domain-containing protein [Bacteroidota bacterium]